MPDFLIVDLYLTATFQVVSYLDLHLTLLAKHNFSHFASNVSQSIKYSNSSNPVKLAIAVTSQF